MNLSILPLNIAKHQGRQGSLTLIRQPILEKRKTWNSKPEGTVWRKCGTLKFKTYEGGYVIKPRDQTYFKIPFEIWIWSTTTIILFSFIFYFIHGKKLNHFLNYPRLWVYGICIDFQNCYPIKNHTSSECH